MSFDILPESPSIPPKKVIVDVWPGDTWSQVWAMVARVTGQPVDLSGWAFTCLVGGESAVVDSSRLKAGLIGVTIPASITAALSAGAEFKLAASRGEVVRTFVSGRVTLGKGGAPVLVDAAQRRTDRGQTSDWSDLDPMVLLGLARGDKGEDGEDGGDGRPGEASPDFIAMVQQVSESASTVGQARDAAENAASEARSSADVAANHRIAATSSASEAKTHDASATASSTSAAQSKSEAASAALSASASSTTAAQAAGAASSDAISAGLSAESAARSRDAAAASAALSETYADAGDEATLASAKAYVDRRSSLVWDSAVGRYTNQSIVSMLASRRDGLAYGVSIPKGSAVACTKTAANAGVPVPVPGVIGRPAVDKYSSLGPFFTLEVNGGVEANGVPYVTAVQGDGNFARDGSNGDVWILAPVLYWRSDESGVASVELTVADSQLPGLLPQPKASLPGGGLRPFMLYAKYALSIVGGVARSISGRPIQNRIVSHNSLITQCKTATTGYSGKSYADDWYMKTMFLLKYATKNSQSVFAGVTNASTQTAVTVAESGATRVIVATSAAAGFVIGSAAMLGAAPVPTDRGAVAAYNTFDGLRVVKKEDLGGGNTAVYVNSGIAFTTVEGQQLSAAPWNTGGCDHVVGDGSPSNPLSSREPHVLQGIELSLGVYEVLGDVIVSSDGVSGWKIFLNPDSKAEATGVTGVYIPGGSLPESATDATVWPMYPSSPAGLMHGVGAGASSTTGVCDGSYVNGTAVVGERQWLSLGSLRNSSGAGLFIVHGLSALSIADWNIGSRLSANGRSGGETP